MSDYILMFVTNLFASLIGTSIALVIGFYIQKRFSREQKEQIEKTKRSIQQTVRRLLKKLTGE